ncbi:MAG: class I SAM-dependent methyltransferase [Aphanocapsa lilacina HA4352-LM1]|jgi:2-polyprenyl-3-methyl-5-hydroxy-6-metoxy-1,4-benzoquinol methylase|nr:class I SAM-dependent methyltransferase [Aphanocapsa lilacina HA4352-LM1]
MEELLLLDKLRRQYDQTPYPKVAIESVHDRNSLWLHSFTTPYYHRHRRLPPSGAPLRILDAGCGSGFTSLALAQANPGAQLVCLDLSAASLAVACERLAFHGFTDVEFHDLPLEQVGELGRHFDLINCDEVLYLLPDPGVGLAALAGVLAPDGILRANLHSAYARAPVFRAQRVFQMMGLTNGTPGEAEMELVRSTMDALNNSTHLKIDTWVPCIHLHDDLEWYQLNYLLAGDKGYTVPEVFALLAGANLEFISMVLWPTWDVRCLFRDPDRLPPLFAERLADKSPIERLHLYELIHSPHRLIDFWCAHPAQQPAAAKPPALEHNLRLHLHPQLRTDSLRERLEQALGEGKPFELQQHIRFPFGEPLPDAQMAGCLLPLWDGPMELERFERQWLEFAHATGQPEPVARPGAARRFAAAAEGLLYLLFEFT